MSELRVYGNGFIFAEIDKGLMDPVADVLQRTRFTVIFQDFQFEHLNDSLREVGKIVIDVFIAHLGLKVVLPFANSQHMSDVIYWNL